MAANDTLGLNQVFQIYHEDGTEYEGLVMHKSATDSIVMSLGDSILGDVYWRNNELQLTMKEYITYNGVNYVLVNPPTIVREGMVADNSELKGMTKYSFKFYHPMYQLGNFPFTDVAVTNDQKKYLSENKTFSWIGTANDFLAKLNKNLDGTEWIVEMSSNFPNDKKTEMSDVIAFDKNTVADAMKTGYDTWGVPYVIDIVSSSEASYASGKRFKVVWGLPSNEIYESAAKKQLNEPYIFKMGKGVGLKNNSRTPRNNKIITRIAGYGSENNIPYGYPQIIWTGNQSWNYTVNNNSSAANSYPIYDGIVGGQKVRLIKHPFTRTHLMPNVYVNAVNKKVNPYATGYNPDIELKDYYDATAGEDYPNPINLNAPSYDIHEFDDIKPELGQESIVAVTPLNPDLTPASSWDDTMDDDGNYVQSYFQITLPTLTFDIYACAAITEAMEINVRSGACLGCTFPVEVDWEDYKANFYKENGDFDPVIHTAEGDGHVRNGKKYPDSSNSSTPVKLILKKENATFGTLMPNIYQHPASGDQFVVLGISLPTSYITNAQTRLDNAMKSYMLENNVYYYDYPLKFDEAFLRKNTYILQQIKPNSIIRFKFAGENLSLYVKQMNVKFGEGVLPKYDITLTDNVDVVLNQIGKVSDDVDKLTTLISLLRQSYGNNVWAELSKKLSKTDDDTAQGLIRFVKGLQVGERFVTGLLGEGGVFNKDADGKTYIEADKLYIRMKAYFDTVEIRKYMHSAGNRIASLAGIKCVRVDNMAWYAAENKYVPVDNSGTYRKKDINGDKYVVATGLSIVRYRCYFRGTDNDGDNVTNDFVVGDQAYCHITNEANVLTQRHYWRLVVGIDSQLTEDGEHWIDLSNRSTETILGITYAGYQTGSNIPVAQDDIVQLGNVNKQERRGAIIEFVSDNDAPSYQIYQNLGTPSGQASQFSLDNKNYIGIGYKSTTGRAYMNVYGDFLFGDKAESTYIKYNAGTKKLEIKADVKFKSPDDPTQDTTLEDFANAITDDIDNLQSQIDGQIETWFYDYDPTVVNAPASNWTTVSEKNNHLGDLFYNTTSGYAWRWGREETAPNVYEYKWYRITDVDVVKALADAAKAQDTADHKRRVFTAQPYPPYDVGDLWSNAIFPANNTEKDAANNKYYKDLLTCKTAKAEGGSFDIADWGLSTNYTDDTALTDFVSNTYAPFVQNIQGQVDQKAETWYQDDDPSLTWTTDALKASHVGDIWCNTSQNGGKKTYIWKDFGTSANTRYAWAEQAVPDAVFDKIDGKADIFVSKPTTYNVNDMWIIESGLSSTYMPTGCQSGDIVISSASRVNNYKKTDWSKKDRYTDDTKYNNFISELLNGMPQGSTEATVEAALNAIKAALNQGTTIGGGLVLTTLIGLRDSSDVLWSGISGAYDSTQLGNGIAAWYGGAMVDIESITGTAKTAYDNLTPAQKAASANYAKTLFRFDGSGYLASTNIRWTADGKVYLSNLYTGSNNPISNLFFDAFAIGIDGSTSYINPQFTFNHIDIVRRTGVGDTITDSSVLNYGEIKSRFVSIDFFNRLFQAYSNEAHADNQKVNPNDTTTTINNLKILVGTWTNQYLSALGLNSQSGGGGGVGDVTWDLLAATATDNRTIDLSYISSALTGYATQLWVTSQISGKVSRVDVGTTQYSPSGGIVSLPAYPTKSSWNYDDVYLKLAGGTMENTNVVTNLNADLVDGYNATEMYALGWHSVRTYSHNSSEGTRYYWFKISKPTASNGFASYEILVRSNANYPRVAHYILDISSYAENTYSYSLYNIAYNKVDCQVYITNDTEYIYIQAKAVWSSELAIRCTRGVDEFVEEAVGLETAGVADGFTPTTDIRKNSCRVRINKTSGAASEVGLSYIYTNVIVPDGTSSQFLRADGTVSVLSASDIPDLSSAYATTSRVTTLEGYFTEGAAKKALADVNDISLVSYKKYSRTFPPNDGTLQWYTICEHIYNNEYYNQTGILQISTRSTAATILFAFFYYSKTYAYGTVLDYSGRASSLDGGFTGRIRVIKDGNNAIIQGQFYAASSTQSNRKMLSLKVTSIDPSKWELPNALEADTSTYESFMLEINAVEGGMTVRNINPLTDNKYDIGSSSLMFKNAYLKGIDGFVSFDITNNRVGIGINSPLEMLHVNGNIKTATDNGTYIQIGEIRIGYDSNNTALEVYRVDNNGNHIDANFYATGAVSALGSNSQSGSGAGDVTWDLLAATATDNRTIDLSYISSALTGYATQLWVTSQSYMSQSSGDVRYLKLAGGTMANTNVVTNLNADLLDGYHESSFFRSAIAYVDTAYIDIEDYTSGAEGFVSLRSGTYTIHRDGHTELLAHFHASGSTSALELMTNYSDNSGLFYRKTIDNNRVSGQWRYFITSYNIGAQNVNTAKKLKTARTIWGQSFDGSANVSGNMTGVTNIDSLLHFDTTNNYVGIGVSSPSSTLDVNGKITINNEGGYAIEAYGQLRFNASTDSTSHSQRVILGCFSGTGATAYQPFIRFRGNDNTTRDFAYMDGNNDYKVGAQDKAIYLYGRNVFIYSRANTTDDTAVLAMKAISYGRIFIGESTSNYSPISNTDYKLIVRGNQFIDGKCYLYRPTANSDSGAVWIEYDTNAGAVKLNGNVQINGTLTGATSIDGLMYFNTTNTQTKFASNDTLVQLTRSNGIFTPKLYVDGYAGFNGEIFANGLDLVGSNASGNVHGGYIDFHYNASTADFTTRIIESANGVLSIMKSSGATGFVVGTSTNNDYIQIGAIRIEYDSFNTALKVVGSDGSSAANFYATGAVSALGDNSGSGGGGVGDVTWDALATTATGGRTIHYSYINDAVLSYGYISQLSADNRYIKLNGTSSINGDLIPASTASNLWLGSSSYHWTEGHIDNIYMDATTNDSKIQITGAASTLTINATSINNPAATLSIQNSNDAQSLSLCSGGGNVGVGTSPNSSYKLYVNGNTSLNGLLIVKDFFIQNSGPNYYNIGGNGLTVYQNGTWTGGSDIRRKDIVTNIGCDINQIASAPIFDFTWKADITRTVHLGTSAQYWSKVFENAVSEGGDGYLYMDYGATALASAVITARKVLDHEGRIRLLEIENQALRKEIEQLKKAA